ncbi:uncharacterized protein LOC101848541 [Aplysia californica]|uniref:Uncharacterized protein LOC101848541 n=1 Tax=Aplysia californica TaxID=6500 RepID=A0ABM0K1Z3_APLCA|nr:uncharacterized protein LOC101848541 [Aplysia californica]XP_005106849.1 uncharacterized protein LOC101848541 [Aplysia californica]XP_005106850.1 uncharacterized protein LOC101848541 [Aplysia californica]XP_005106851.1 uncharacterized protein LOC101848541 [Aplysia californica]
MTSPPPHLGMSEERVSDSLQEEVAQILTRNFQHIMGGGNDCLPPGNSDINDMVDEDDGSFDFMKLSITDDEAFPERISGVVGEMAQMASGGHHHHNGEECGEDTSLESASGSTRQETHTGQGATPTRASESQHNGTEKTEEGTAHLKYDKACVNSKARDSQDKDNLTKCCKEMRNIAKENGEGPDVIPTGSLLLNDLNNSRKPATGRTDGGLVGLSGREEMENITAAPSADSNQSLASNVKCQTSGGVDDATGTMSWSGQEQLVEAGNNASLTEGNLSPDTGHDARSGVIMTSYPSVDGSCSISADGEGEEEAQKALFDEAEFELEEEDFKSMLSLDCSERNDVLSLNITEEEGDRVLTDRGPSGNRPVGRPKRSPAPRRPMVPCPIQPKQPAATTVVNSIVTTTASAIIMPPGNSRNSNSPSFPFPKGHVLPLDGGGATVVGKYPVRFVHGPNGPRVEVDAKNMIPSAVAMAADASSSPESEVEKDRVVASPKETEQIPSPVPSSAHNMSISAASPCSIQIDGPSLPSTPSQFLLHVEGHPCWPPGRRDAPSSVSEDVLSIAVTTSSNTSFAHLHPAQGQFQQTVPLTVHQADPTQNLRQNDFLLYDGQQNLEILQHHGGQSSQTGFVNDSVSSEHSQLLPDDLANLGRLVGSPPELMSPMSNVRQVSGSMGIHSDPVVVETQRGRYVDRQGRVEVSQGVFPQTVSTPGMYLTSQAAPRLTTAPVAVSQYVYLPDSRFHLSTTSTTTTAAAAACGHSTSGPVHGHVWNQGESHSAQPGSRHPQLVLQQRPPTEESGDSRGLYAVRSGQNVVIHQRPATGSAWQHGAQGAGSSSRDSRDLLQQMYDSIPSSASKVRSGADLSMEQMYRVPFPCPSDMLPAPGSSRSSTVKPAGRVAPINVPVQPKQDRTARWVDSNLYHQPDLDEGISDPSDHSLLDSPLEMTGIFGQKLLVIQDRSDPKPSTTSKQRPPRVAANSSSRRNAEGESRKAATTSSTTSSSKKNSPATTNSSQAYKKSSNANVKLPQANLKSSQSVHGVDAGSAVGPSAALPFCSGGASSSYSSQVDQVRRNVCPEDKIKTNMFPVLQQTSASASLTEEQRIADIKRALEQPLSANSSEHQMLSIKPEETEFFSINSEELVNLLAFPSIPGAGTIEESASGVVQVNRDSFPFDIYITPSMKASLEGKQQMKQETSLEKYLRPHLAPANKCLEPLGAHTLAERKISTASNSSSQEEDRQKAVKRKQAQSSEMMTSSSDRQSKTVPLSSSAQTPNATGFRTSGPTLNSQVQRQLRYHLALNSLSTQPSGREEVTPPEAAPSGPLQVQGTGLLPQSQLVASPDHHVTHKASTSSGYPVTSQSLVEKAKNPKNEEVAGSSVAAPFCHYRMGDGPEASPQFSEATVLGQDAKGRFIVQAPRASLPPSQFQYFLPQHSRPHQSQPDYLLSQYTQPKFSQQAQPRPTQIQHTQPQHAQSEPTHPQFTSQSQFTQPQLQSCQWQHIYPGTQQLDLAPALDHYSQTGPTVAVVQSTHPAGGWRPHRQSSSSTTNTSTATASDDNNFKVPSVKPRPYPTTSSGAQSGKFMGDRFPSTQSHMSIGGTSDVSMRSGDSLPHLEPAPQSSRHHSMGQEPSLTTSDMSISVEETANPPPDSYTQQPGNVNYVVCSADGMLFVGQSHYQTAGNNMKYVPLETQDSPSDLIHRLHPQQVQYQTHISQQMQDQTGSQVQLPSSEQSYPQFPVQTELRTQLPSQTQVPVPSQRRSRQQSPLPRSQQRSQLSKSQVQKRLEVERWLLQQDPVPQGAQFSSQAFPHDSHMAAGGADTPNIMMNYAAASQHSPSNVSAAAHNRGSNLVFCHASPSGVSTVPQTAQGYHMARELPSQVNAVPTFLPPTKSAQRVQSGNPPYLGLSSPGQHPSRALTLHQQHPGNHSNQPSLPCPATQSLAPVELLRLEAPVWPNDQGSSTLPDFLPDQNRASSPSDLELEQFMLADSFPPLDLKDDPQSLFLQERGSSSTPSISNQKSKGKNPSPPKDSKNGIASNSTSSEVRKAVGAKSSCEERDMSLGSGSEKGHSRGAGDLSVEKISLESSSVEIPSFEKDDDGETYVHWLCDMPQLQRVKVASLPGFHDALDTLSNNQETALFVAVRRGNLEVVKLLLSHGADPNILCSSPGSNANLRSETVRQTVLHEAAETGHADILKELLLKDGVYLDAPRPGSGFTPLMTALHVHAQQNRDKIIWMLIHNRCSLTAKDNLQGMTPLMFAIKTRDVHLVEEMLKAVGAANARGLVTHRARAGQTCLHFVAQLRTESAMKQNLMRMIIHAGGDPSAQNDEGETAKDWSKADMTKVLQDLAG